MMSNNIYKTAILVQLHKDSEYVKELAKIYPNVNFYLHFDAKSHIDLVAYSTFPNVFVIENRVNVRWGGFSQVKTTLSLLDMAFKDPNNFFFHLISGEDCILKPLDKIAAQMSKEQPEIYIDFRYSLKHRHRSRFFAPHADTSWQRSFIGKVLTKINVLLDKVIPISEENNQRYSIYGSQWFSINRLALEKVLSVTASSDCIEYFSKRLVPDEHFFQYVLENFQLKQHSKGSNKRFIDLPDDRNHPRYIELPELLELSNQGYWMARKVEQSVLLAFLRGKND